MAQTNLTTTPASNESRHCEAQEELQTSLAVLYTIIFIPGLFGNLVALWVFFFVHSKKNSVRVFLINIALADLLLMVCLPFRMIYHSQGNRWRLGPTLCSVVGNLFYMNMYMSITLLGMISVDRYLKIYRGVGMDGRITTRGSIVACAVTWAGAMAFIMPIMMSKNRTQTDRCFFYRQLLEDKWKAYINIAVVVIFFLVFIILMTSYVKIGYYLRKKSLENPDFPSASHYKRSAKKSFFILFLFTVCFVPYHLVRIFYIKTQITDTSCFLRGMADRANEIALVFSAFNSCLDPVMYFLLSSSVRREVLRLAGRVLYLREVVVNRVNSSTLEMEREPVSNKGQLRISSVVIDNHKS
ncbi:probable G-protein coupled receptor 34 isoform X2 [Boleophthalmus pectinirostris]|uniref:probable G-protein coupled receptor 34 isoform X2 n=1 Tax=Boleophthalmus pectinirostris TaxID=150288 RepID=UPI00242EAFBF|nr:probable G-protein coupled receptor 34 isoform X2 [Boleophthalmus pectinirostris]